MSPRYQPPFTLTAKIVSQVAAVAERIGRLSALASPGVRLRRINRIRTIRGSLAIEGNTLSEAQITAILDGKPVIAPPREVQEARNALASYEQLARWKPSNERHLLAAHASLMRGLVEDAGRYREGGVGVMRGGQVIHMAPPASRVALLMRDLLRWLAKTDQHPLIASSVFHYEFEFIHPFSDGNGRLGRLWQTLILSRWNPLFAHVPVESLVHAHQAGYYHALGESTHRGDCAVFVEFMLDRLLEAIQAHSAADTTDPVADPVTDPVDQLLRALASGPLAPSMLLARLGLRHRPTFRSNYLRPALEGRWIEMTLPDKPSSRLQQYRLTAAGRARLQALTPRDPP